MALVAFIANPKEVFEHKAKPEFDEVAVIDIAGGGIRSLNYDPILKTYIIANEVKDEAGERFSQLWTWSGKHSDEPQKITLPNLQHIKKRGSRRFHYRKRQAAPDCDGRRGQRLEKTDR